MSAQTVSLSSEFEAVIPRRLVSLIRGTARWVCRWFAVCGLLMLYAPSAFAQSYQWTNFAGLPGGPGNVDGTISTARFHQPTAVAMDGSGNFYVADFSNHTIRKVSSGGVVSTLAGLAGNSGSSDGTGSAARFYYPNGVAVDSSGNVYVADQGNHTIRKVTPGGVVTTLAGLAGTFGSSNGTGSSARFYDPSGLAVDGSGNVYVADTANNTIRKITPGGAVSTLAGLAGTYGSNDGTGNAALFYYPSGVAVDGSGNLYVADSGNNTIRKVTPGGVVTTLAGFAGSIGSADGTGSAAQFNNPHSVTVDASGNVYVADSNNNTIRKVTPGGVVTTLAGLAGLAGSGDGTGSAARFNNPYGVAVDGSGNVYVADNNNYTIRRVTPAGVVSTIGGTAGVAAGADGIGAAASFSGPEGIAVSSAGAVFVTDTSNQRISKGVVVQYPIPVTAAASSITTTGASLNGTVNANGFSTAVSFDYGLTTAYGTHVAGTPTPVTGSSATAVSAVINGLSPGTTYHFRVIGTNSQGTANGTDQTFTTNGAPTTVTVAASSVFNNTATLNGTVSANGLSSTVSFDYGLTTAYGTTVAGTPTPVTGSSTTAVSAAIASLSPGTTYHFRVNGTNSQGTTHGSDQTFTTTAVPTSTTLGAASISNTGATLNGTVNANGYSSAVSFDYGLTTAYGTTVAGTPTPVTGSSATAVSTVLTGLSPGTTYHFRAGGTSSQGTAYGSDQTFTTSAVPPTSATLAASSTTANGATLNGTVNANGYSTTVSFDYGLTTAYGTNIAGTPTTVTGGSATAVTAALTGLIPGTTYHFRVNGTSSQGVALGSDQTFTTPAVPIATTLGAALISATGATLNGTMNADGYSTAVSFDYGLTTAYGTNVAATPTPVTGSSTTAVSAVITGLSLGTTYHFRVKGTNSQGTTYGNDQTFFTNGAPGQYVWTNFAGMPGGSGNADGMGSAARFNNPIGVAVDASGNVYVADQFNQTIRKVSPGGVVTTLAGLKGNPGSSDGTGSAARFNYPTGVAVDTSGNVYVADSQNNTIRKITPAGVVSTLAGLAGNFGSSSDGTGSAARFNSPQGVAVDSSGNVYVADYGNYTIRRVTPGGVVTTLAGLAANPGSSDGTGSAAQFYNPRGVAVDASGNVYVADSFNNTIRKVTPSGIVTTLAGLAGTIGSSDGTGSAATFHYPASVAVDANGNVYVGDSANNTIRKVTPGGLVTTLAGLAGSSGSADGMGNAALFSNPQGVAVDASGNVYVGDEYNHTIRKVTSGGMVTTLAGLAGSFGSSDGTGSAARFGLPFGVAVDGSGNAYVADTLNHTIRKVTPGGVVSTLAGLAGSFGSIDGTGSAARFNNPQGLAVDASGNVYVADTANNTIRKVTPAGVVSTLAGSPAISGSIDGMGSTATFYNPSSVAVDASGNVYVADEYNYIVRKITPDGLVSTLAGLARTTGSNDGTGNAARFNLPTGVAVDGSGNVYVADSYNSTIRKVTPSGVVSTLAGLAGSSGSSDGTGSAARFGLPFGVAVDSSGNVYVADNTNLILRKVTPLGVVTTIGGNVGVASSADGVGSSALFASPTGIAVTSAGTLFVADATNNRISMGIILGAPVSATAPATSISSSGATLNGTVNAKGLITTVSFDYGLTTAYGTNVAGTPTPVTGSSATAVSAVIAGLSPGTTYHFRVNGTNSGGTTNSSDQTFTTAVYTPVSWRQQWFSTTSNSGSAADNADPYHTGVPNLVTFALLGPNQDPAKVSAAMLPQPQNSGGNFVYSFTQPAGISNITYGAQYTTSLTPANWQPVTDTGSGTLHIFSVPIGSNARMFMRLTLTNLGP